MEAKKSRRTRLASVALLCLGFLALNSDNLRTPRRYVRSLEAVDFGNATVELGNANAVSSKVSRESEGAEIWVINQPKCGTGAMQGSVLTAWNCVKISNSELLYEGSCANGAVLYRTHDPNSATEEKKRLIEEKKAAGTKPGSCMVLSAIRNPMLSIPSFFFEKNSDLCDGERATDDVIQMYEDFLHSDVPNLQMSVAAAVLEEFGVTDFKGAVEALEEDGFRFFTTPDPDSPWAGCELLLMMIDYDEQNTNIHAGFDQFFEDIMFRQNDKREELCPNAADLYHALQNYELTDEHISVMTQDNPELKDGIDFYRKLQSQNAHTSMY